MSSIDFYFDFSSPYGYFSSTKIDSVASRYGRTVSWRPYLMGVVMRITERKPLVHIPMVNEYSARDLPRTARYYDIEFNHPTTFPIATVAACRAFYWLNEQDPAKAKQLAHELFRAYFVEDVLISDSGIVASVASRIGVAPDETEAALADNRVKQLVRDATDSAIANKVFGSPFFVVEEGESFWGHDRLNQVEKWLESGGW